jgi:hypothetical protein
MRIALYLLHNGVIQDKTVERALVIMKENSALGPENTLDALSP